MIECRETHTNDGTGEEERKPDLLCNGNVGTTAEVDTSDNSAETTWKQQET